MQVHNLSSYSIKRYRSHEEGDFKRLLNLVLIFCAWQLGIKNKCDCMSGCFDLYARGNKLNFRGEKEELKNKWNHKARNMN